MRTEALEALVTIAICSVLGAVVSLQISTIQAINELWWLVVVVVLMGVVGAILILATDKLTPNKKSGLEPDKAEFAQMI
jgi:hypothetical protein